MLHVGATLDLTEIKTYFPIVISYVSKQAVETLNYEQLPIETK